MLKVCDVEKKFNKQPVLRGLSFDVPPAEIVGLVGPSGAGKSVLLKLMGGVIEPDAGTITAFGDAGRSRDMTVGFLFQEGALFDSMNVLENVAFPIVSPKTFGFAGGMRFEKIGYSEARQRAYDILDEVGLSEAYLKLPGQLSGGMRRRVALARALVGHPDLVLLDDPTGGLDPVAASVIMNLIRTLHAHYKPTVVMVSHDLRRLLPRVDRILALFEGVIVCDKPVGRLVAEAPVNVLKFLKTRYDFESSPLVESEVGVVL